MRVLNFGSLTIDLVCRVAHVVRPGETLAGTTLERHAGGKGANQSAALALAGARVFHAGRQTVRVEAWPTRVVDTTGAGDTFIGYFVARRIAGDGVEAALRIASKAAAIAVSRPGAMDAIPRFDEVTA